MSFEKCTCSCRQLVAGGCSALCLLHPAGIGVHEKVARTERRHSAGEERTATCQQPAASTSHNRSNTTSLTSCARSGRHATSCPVAQRVSKHRSSGYSFQPVSSSLRLSPPRCFSTSSTPRPLRSRDPRRAPTAMATVGWMTAQTTTLWSCPYPASDRSIPALCPGWRNSNTAQPTAERRPRHRLCLGVVLR